jgi:CRISPR-associated exonuclease Cas4
VRLGYLYLFGTNERYAITITDWHRNKVLEVVQAIRSMSLDRIPDFADNPKKCEKCSTAAYCLPEETRMLQEESARREHGWKDEQTRIDR